MHLKKSSINKINRMAQHRIRPKMTVVFHSTGRVATFKKIIIISTLMGRLALGSLKQIVSHLGVCIYKTFV